MIKVDWYFDYISPFAYLQWQAQLPKLDDVIINYKPILFAGLLKHWSHKGPAEIPDKRKFTYRHSYWLAQRLNVEFRMPIAHPFNPLPLLRLTLARQNSTEIINRLFDFVWQQGHIPKSEKAWSNLKDELAFTEEELNQPSIKQTLRSNGEQAIADGVFGVPTLVANGEPFWGVDAFDFFLDYVKDNRIIDNPVVRELDNLPSGV